MIPRCPRRQRPARHRTSVFLLAALAAGILLPRAAFAIPAFARKYGAPCSLCHAQSYPALNGFGRQFKENGYQYLEAAEAEPRARSGVIPDPDEKLLVLSSAPLAVRAASSAVLSPDPKGNDESPLELRPFESLSLLAGASVYPDVSLFASLTLVPEAALHHAALGFHNLLFGPGHLNLRVGRLLLLDHQRPEHRTLTRFGNPIATTRLGLNPVVLDSTQHGIEVFGRAAQRRLFYRAGVVQGAQGPDGVADLDRRKDIFAEVHVIPWAPLTLGALGYLGRTQIVDERLGVRTRFSDAFSMAIAFAELALGRVNLFLQGARAAHRDPAGTGEHDDYWGVRGEVRVSLSPRLLLVARYDEVVTHHDAELRVRQATVHLDYLLLGNVRLAVESTAPLRDLQSSGLTLLLDVAL